MINENLLNNNEKSSETMLEACLGCQASDLANLIVISPLWGPGQVAPFFTRVEKRFFRPHWWQGVTGYLNNSRISWLYCRPGRQSAFDLVYLLGKMGLSSKLIFTGTAGSLIEDLSCGGKLLVDCAGSLRKSFSLDPAGKLDRENIHIEQADKKLIKQLDDIIQSIDASNYQVGKVFTADSIWAETKNNLAILGTEQFAGIDLETAAVFAAANIFGQAVAALHLISDEPLVKPVWHKLSSDKQLDLKKSLGVWPGFVLNLASGLGA